MNTKLHAVSDADGRPLPYTANQIAALRRPISCWMNIANLETLSLVPDRDRRTPYPDNHRADREG